MHARRTALPLAAGRRFVGTALPFYPTKNMTTGEGGMITTDDPALAERMRPCASMACACAMSTRRWGTTFA